MTLATYEEVKTLPPTSLLVDVREPHELQETGVLPNSINIPLAHLVEAFKASIEDFEDKYGRKKPDVDQDIVFSCKLGGRAQRAMNAIAELGYNNLRYYKGSWTEWAEKSKQ